MFAKKVGVVSLGCPKNTVDSEIILGILKKGGYEITVKQEEADIIIVNTCAFIEDAVQESINTILEMAKYKDKNLKLLVTAGCLAERYKSAIMDEIPEVDAVIGPGFYGDIKNILEKLYDNRNSCMENVLVGKAFAPSCLDNERLLSTPPGYAYLKIAEGCSNRCTYCIIPRLRGAYVSRKPESIINEIKILNSRNIKEIIVVAQDTTRYGEDIKYEPGLPGLVDEMSKRTNAQWIRLLYGYPEKISDNLIDVIANNKKVCKYIDVPLQHISDSVLERMGRRGRSADIKKMMETLRRRIPEITIRTTLITGFPGEDEKDFGILYDFIKEYEFDRLGVFKYSPEEGTVANSLPCQVPEAIKNERYYILMGLQKEISLKKNRARLGKIFSTMVEGISDDGIFYFGRTQHEAPEIDGKVYFASKRPLNAGDIVNVKILDCDEYDVTGEVCL
jgi:ribosomal protein S12 methylthiotransferase